MLFRSRERKKERKKERSKRERKETKLAHYPSNMTPNIYNLHPKLLIH